MIVPVAMIIFTRNNIIAGLTSKDMTTVVHYSKTLLGQINHVVLVPIICYVGVLNPDLVKSPYLQRPSRTFLWVICLLEIIFALVQYTVRNIEALQILCNGNEEACIITSMFMLMTIQFAIIRSLTITIVGISSKQIITAIESEEICIQSVQNNIISYEKMKKSLSAVLFVGLSYEILACVVNSYSLVTGTIDQLDALIQTLFSISIVFYYCLSLDDCFEAFKEYIFVVR